MKAKYLGNPSPEDDGPRRVGFGGKTFPRGLFVPVDDLDAKLVGKLSTHPLFEVSQDPMSDGEAGDLDAATVVAVEPANASADSADKDAVIARLDAMQKAHPEVEFDRRLGVAKLKAILEAAEFEHGED